MNRESSPGLLLNPWFQLVVGIVGMVAITNLQYGWTLFVDPLQRHFGWREKEIQFAFTLFVLAETWLVPLEGYLVDRFGPRWMVMLGGLLVGFSWVFNSTAETLTGFYFGNTVGGIGAGIVYGTSMGNALKWFTKRRGLAVGLTAAAFGAGSALTVVPIRGVIGDGSGYRDAFLWFGLGQGITVLVCALLLRVPPGLVYREQRPALTAPSNRDFTVWEMVQAPIFWLMYAMMTLVSVGGLMAIAQIALMARDYGVADVPFDFSLGGQSLTLPALTLALALDRILNGLSRPFFGWISDYLGRENTMFVAFGLEGAAILLLMQFAHQPTLFVVLTGLTFFAWGEIYSLFPALCGDLFGRRFAAANYGLLYTAKGMAALLVPLGNAVKDLSGSWQPVFSCAVAFDWFGALAAILILKPWRIRWQAAAGNRIPPPIS